MVLQSKSLAGLGILVKVVVLFLALGILLQFSPPQFGAAYVALIGLAFLLDWQHECSWKRLLKQLHKRLPKLTKVIAARVAKLCYVAPASSPAPAPAPAAKDSTPPAADANTTAVSNLEIEEVTASHEPLPLPRAAGTKGELSTHVHPQNDFVFRSYHI